MSQAASRSFAVSVAVLAGVRLLGVATGFAVSVIGARALSQAEFGAAGVVITLGTVAALLFNGGVNISAIYFAGRLPDRRAAVLGTTASIAMTGAALAALAMLAGGAVFGGALQLAGRPELFMVGGLAAAAIIGFEYGGAILLAIGRRRDFTVVELVRSIVALMATLGLLVLWRTDTAFVAAAALAYLAAAALALGLGQRSTGEVTPTWDGSLARQSLSMGLRGQLGNVLQFINLRLDLLLIPALMNLSAAGLYVVAVRVAEVLTQAANAAGSFLFPAIAEQTDAVSTELTNRTVRISLIIVIAAAVLLGLVAAPLLELAFGEAYLPATTSLRILAAAMVPLSLARVLAGDLKGRGRAGLVSAAMGATVVVTAILDLVLIPRLGIDGAAIASLGAYTVSAGILLIAFRSVTGASIRSLMPGPGDALGLVRAVRRE
jgi:stage V sporulation protein B